MPTKTTGPLEPVNLSREIWRVIAASVCQSVNVPHISRGDKSQRAVMARQMFIAYLRAMGYSSYRIGQDLEIARSYMTVWKRRHAERVVYDTEYRRLWSVVRCACDTAVREWEVNGYRVTDRAKAES